MPTTIITCASCGNGFYSANNRRSTTCQDCRRADKEQRALTAMEREWRVVYDSSGDFTGKWFSNLDVDYMCKDGSFDAGAVLENSEGERYRYDVNKRRLVAV